MSKFSDITKLKEKLVNDISKSEDISQLEDIRISSLGKKGSITLLLKNISTQKPEDKKDYGEQVNLLKRQIAEEIEKVRGDFLQKDILEKINQDKIDVTLPIRNTNLENGRIHPITQVMEEILKMTFIILIY
jgi:phenylalanyl-tRNA synthetase alpha chain